LLTGKAAIAGESTVAQGQRALIADAAFTPVADGISYGQLVQVERYP
jgi:hypothetical protein